MLKGGEKKTPLPLSPPTFGLSPPSVQDFILFSERTPARSGSAPPGCRAATGAGALPPLSVCQKTKEGRAPRTRQRADRGEELSPSGRGGRTNGDREEAASPERRRRPPPRAATPPGDGSVCSRQITQSIGISLNGSQCGGCSHKYDTPTETRVVCKGFSVA